MAKKVTKKEENFTLEEDNDILELVDEAKETVDSHQEAKIEIPPETYIEQKEVMEKVERPTKKEVIPSCLRKETVRVNFIVRPDNRIKDPKHVLYGGMLETSKKMLTVPTLRNGNYVNVLTDNEKDFLEKEMQLEPNSLSIYKKIDNYWDNYQVTIGKDGLKLDLSIPDDYIAYKVLLANTNLIAHSFDDINKKTSYIFYISKEGDEAERANKTINSKKDAYIKFGKIEDKKDDLRYVLQIMSNKVLAKNTKLEQLKAWVGEEIDTKAKLFLEIVNDEFYYTKKLIYKGVEKGVIRKNGDFYFIQGDMGLEQLSHKGEDPTFKNAVIYLDSPKYQDIRLRIEAKIQKLEE